MIRLLQTIIFLLPLLLTAETITIKTKASQNRSAVFQYRVPKGYDQNRREMYRVLVIFGGSNTDNDGINFQYCHKRDIDKFYVCGYFIERKNLK